MKLGPEVLEFEIEKYNSLKKQSSNLHLKNFQINFTMSKLGPNVMMKRKNCTTLKGIDKKKSVSRCLFHHLFHLFENDCYIIPSLPLTIGTFFFLVEYFVFNIENEVQQLQFLIFQNFSRWRISMQNTSCVVYL
jgi:hypothetical protein